MLTKYSQEVLNKRVESGDALLGKTWGYPPTIFEDREAAAKDAISDILTALYGNAGAFRRCSDGEGFVLEPDFDVREKARELAQRAVDAYLNDAEDYFDSPPSPAEKLKQAIEAKNVESHRIFLYAGGHEDAFRENVSDEEIVQRFNALTDEESDRIFTNFRSEDYEAMDEIRGVITGLGIALNLIEDAQ